MICQSWLGLCISTAVCVQPPPSDSSNAGADPKSAAPIQAIAISAMERFNKRLEEIDAAVAKVVDVRARFEQRRQTPLLKKPMVSKGEMIARGEIVRWDTKEPRKSTMLVGSPSVASGQGGGQGGGGGGGGPEIRMYYPDDKLIEVYETGDKAREFMGAILPRLTTLRSQFDLSPLPPKEVGSEQENPHLLAVLLEPREERLRQHVRSVRVLIDDSIPAATRVIITNAQGEQTEISFTDVRVNIGVAKEEMDLHPPGDVRVSYPMRGEPARAAQPNTSEPPVTPLRLPTDRPKTSP